MGNSFGKNTGNVFRFSCAQMLKKKGFLVSTILIAIVIFATIVAIMAFSASDDDEEKEPTKEGKLIVCNETDFVCVDGGTLNTGDIATAIKEEMTDVKDITVEWKDNAVIADEVKKAEEANDEPECFFAVLRKTDDGYGIYMVRPKNCSWSENEVTTAGEAMVPVLKAYVERGIDPMMAIFVQLPRF